VGTRVELDHTGATLMGMKVELQVRIAEVHGRRSPSTSSGSDGVEPSAVPPPRFVVDVAKTEQRLAAKAQKAGLA
jgi:fluoroacetyl-CoA thioesterase